MASAVSGRFGVVNGQSTVRNWSINHISAAQKYVASNTRGGAGRRHGVQDFNGSFGGYGYSPTVLPGQLFSFSGLTAPTSGIEDTPGILWNGAAIVDSVAITYSWAAAEIVSWVCNFSGNGELTSTSGTLADATEPRVFQVCGSNVEINDEIQEDLVNAVFTLTAENQAYVNSASVINGKCWTKRRPGNIDWTLALTQQQDGPAPVGTTTQGIIELPGGWGLSWGHLESLSSLMVDRETGAIIGRTLNYAMDGYKDAIGAIISPLGPFWPTP